MTAVGINITGISCCGVDWDSFWRFSNKTLMAQAVTRMPTMSNKPMSKTGQFSSLADLGSFSLDIANSSSTIVIYLDYRFLLLLLLVKRNNQVSTERER